MDRKTLARVAPFALYMAFVGVEQGGGWVRDQGWLGFSDAQLDLLYPVKIAAVLATLIHYRREYDELRWRELARPATLLLSLAVGIIVFGLWINLDIALGSLTPRGFDPTRFADPGLRWALSGARLFGAVLVVPVMEELFWRSFLIRYIVDSDFSKVPVGMFSWGSFGLTVVLFGLEHHYLIAGMVAGAAYNLLLYRSRSLVHCILAHALTNLILGCYVLQTGAWHFW
jgi:uncharacterized protein